MTHCDDDVLLVPETAPIKKERRGCAANLILVALLLEAARMVDDGFKVVDIEMAAQKAFGVSKGFLVQMDEIGIVKTIAAMENLSDLSDSEDSLSSIYLNFFTPANSCRQILDEYNNAEDKSTVVWVTEEDAKGRPFDLLIVDSLRIRFLAVGFAVTTELVDSEIIELNELETLCKSVLGWEDGPFSLMNKIGIAESLKIVTEKMQLSHRKEINFPVSRLLITQAQKNTPWLVKS